MAYNTKSPVDPFNANPGQDGTGQTDLFKQNLNAIPFGLGEFIPQARSGPYNRF